MNPVMKFLRPAALSCLALIIGWNIAIAQTQVSGIVSDSVNAPISGVSVLVKGTKNGTSTDKSGHFSLSAPSTGVLVFSFVGFETQEIAIDGRQSINVQLQSSTLGLSEVVVTALGIRKETKRIGYSVQEVKGEDLVRRRNIKKKSVLTVKIAG